MFKYEFDSKTIILRAVEEDDLKFLHTMRSDEEINNNLFTLFPISMSSQREWLKNMLSSKTSKVLMVDVNKGGSVFPIGYVKLNNINHVNQNIEVGADIHGLSRGKGYGSVIYQALLDYCFNQLNMIKVYLYVLQDNKRAIKVYENTGFQQEAVLKNHIFKHGRFKNIIMMSKFR